MFTQYDDDGNVQMVEEPTADYGYTYADYLKWKFEERVELFRGRIMKMSAPNRLHQTISIRLLGAFINVVKNKTCQVFHAPFDVRLPRQDRVTDEEIITVVQPDICVICDEKKLDNRGCIGAPDIVVEILSPGNNKKELQNKFEIYEEAGVLEYWIVTPVEEFVTIYYLKNGSYNNIKIFSAGQTITTNILPGFQLNVTDLF